LLLAGLGPGVFGAWAVLLGAVAFLQFFGMGAGPTLVRFLAPPIREGREADVDRIASSGLFAVFGLHLLVLLALLPGAGRLAALLHVPDTPLLSPGALLFLSAAGFSAHSMALLLLAPLEAAEKFVPVALATTTGMLAANVAAWAAALLTHRLDLVAVAYWVAAIVGVLLPALRERARSLPYRLRAGLVDRATLREMLTHGGLLQVSKLCQAVNLNFDKMIIPGCVSIAAVAPYEITGRAINGLRGLPIAALGVLLPEVSGRHAKGEEHFKLYERMTRAAVLSALVFLAAPLALAPSLFRAWAGEIGSTAVPLFLVLAPGFMLNLVSAPVSTMVQGMGRAGLQAAAAGASLVLNIVLSLLLVGRYGVLGAATGTTVAMALSSIAYIAAYHRLTGRPLLVTLRSALRPALPAMPLLPLLAAASWGSRQLLPESRPLLGLVSVGMGGAFLVAALFAIRRWGRLDDLERRSLEALPLIGGTFR
jgi:O-antigen/teichoic acid export membrane protein